MSLSEMVTVLLSTLLRILPDLAPTIPPASLIESGPLSLPSFTTSPSILRSLREAYGVAISNLMICATVSICVSVLATLGMQRLNLATISKEREKGKLVGRDGGEDAFGGGEGCPEELREREKDWTVTVDFEDPRRRSYPVEFI